jgi:hypothetical protein
MQAKADQRSTAPKQPDLVIEKSVSQKIAAEKPAPEAALVAAAQVTPQKAAPQKAAVPESAISQKPEVPEISIDIAWPTPELGVPPSMPQRAAPPTSAPPKPQWALPELDVPLPAVQKQPAVTVAPVAQEAAVSAAAQPPFELQLAPPYSVASAPVLTEVVIPTKSSAPKTAAPKPAVIAAPVLTDAVAPKSKAPPPPIAPPVVVTAAEPIKTPPKPEVAPPAKLEIAPASKQEVAPPAKLEIAPASKHEVAPPAKPEIAAPPKKAIAPPPKQNMAPPSKFAAPKTAAPVEDPKAAPVVTQSVATARRGWPKFRMSSAKAAPNKLTSLQHVVVATAPVPAAREVKKLEEPLESLESTQTIRALTPKELEDNESSRWFVIQLALADHAFDPDAVPNLDIFSEYRLYSVAGLDQGRVVHALRLGFFREEIGAVAVASYLAAFWDKPTIKRVSLAERERFAEQRVEARKDVGATGKHAVIEITDELVARRRRSTKAAAAKIANRPVEH